MGPSTRVMIEENRHFGGGRTDDHESRPTLQHQSIAFSARPVRRGGLRPRRRLHEWWRRRCDDPARRRPRGVCPGRGTVGQRGQARLLSFAPVPTDRASQGAAVPIGSWFGDPTPFSWLAGDDGFGFGMGEQAPAHIARTSITARRRAIRDLIVQLSVEPSTATMPRAIGPESGRGGVVGGDWNTPYPKRWRRHGSMRTRWSGSVGTPPARVAKPEPPGRLAQLVRALA